MSPSHPDPESRGNTPPPAPKPWPNHGFSTPLLPNHGILVGGRMGTFFTHMGQTVRNVVFTFNLDPLVKVFGEPIRHHLSVAVVPIERRTDYFHMKYLGGKSVIVPAGTSLMPFPADIEAAAKRKAEWAFLPIIGPQTDIHFDIELVPHDHNARLTLDVQLHLKPGQANSPEFVPRVVPRS